MGKYYGDQSRVAMLVESGTYANTSGTTGIWIGKVSNHDIDENVNVMMTRYMGTSSRNVSSFEDGTLDYTGVLTYHPQDLRLLGYALGSIVDAGSPSPFTHELSEVNNAAGNAFTSGTHIPFMSFTLEDAKIGSGTGQNFIRTLKGCVIDSWTLKGNQGGLLECEANYIAQSIAYSSGTPTTLTENGSHVTYKWSHVTLHMPSGTAFPEVKSFEFTINNNIDPPHYLNGSRVIATPQATDRDYAFNTTMDMEGTKAKVLYDQYFIGGSEFNIRLNGVVNAGSQDFAIIMSGCKIIDMSSPTTLTEAQETTLSIQPKSANASINDLTQLYNPW